MYLVQESTQILGNGRLNEVCQDISHFSKQNIQKTGQNMGTIISFLRAAQLETNLSTNTKQNYAYALYRLSNYYNNNKSFKQMTQDDIAQFLNSYRKAEPLDPFHKWIGTYNQFLIRLNRFFRWLYYPHLKQEERLAPLCIINIRQLKRKESSIYKPSDMWSTEDDLLFLKYCPSKRDRCYHVIGRDSSCRPYELLKLKLKDVVFKSVGSKQYAEILVNGKTGSRHIPLIASIPYLKDWLDDHPQRNNPNSFLICNIGKNIGRKIGNTGINAMYERTKQYFRSLNKNPTVSPEDKRAISELLKKPWNPYIRRHSALTEKSQLLKEHVLRQHAGWSVSSRMPQRYLHYFGNESSESILEAYGLKPKAEDIDKMKPKQCPNCAESNKIDSKFCAKCRMVLTYDAYSDMEEEKQENEDALTTLSDQLEKLAAEVQELKKQQ